MCLQTAIAFDVKRIVEPPRYSHEELEGRIKLNPGSAEAYCDRGDSFLSAGETDKALPDYNHALKLRPNFARALVGRSQIYQTSSQFDKALRDADAAIKINDSQSLAIAIMQKIRLCKALKRYNDLPPLYE